MAPPMKRKRTCMMAPEAVDERNTDTARDEKNPKTEPEDQPSRPESTQLAKNEATDDLSAQVVRPRCSQCDFPCWLCSTNNAFNPGQEDPARWWSHSEVDAKEDVMKSTTIATTTEKTRKTDKQKFDELDRLFISIRDKRFAKLLERSKIRFQPGSTGMDPEELADLSALTSPRPAVILNLNDDQLRAIGTQLYLRSLKQHNEQELRSYLTQELLRHDVIPAQEDIQYISYRRDSWKPERKGPPVAEDCDVVYNYMALEVDTTFMVNTSMFSQEMRDTLKGSDDLSSWLAESNGVAPYLSFEFKSALSGEPKWISLNQITAAAAIWLFTRKQLRETVATAPISYHDIRHYGVILTADHFTVYEATTDGRHYNLKQVACGMTCKVADLRCFIRWSNAIHLWGLGPNAESFKKDMEDLVRQRKNRLANGTALIRSDE